MEISARKATMKWVELTFNIIYLSVVLLSSVLLFNLSEVGSLGWKFALMALFLGLGDSFHLLPRIFALIDKKGHDYSSSLGIGKLITSITMTIFYVFLWGIAKDYYNFGDSFSRIIYFLALIRIVLSLLPQNQWRSKNPPIKWGIIRNIPFLILGLMVMIQYLVGTIKYGGDMPYMWLAILISFACYMPVVLWVHKNPKLGMLMLPKACAYVTIVLMGFNII